MPSTPTFSRSRQLAHFTGVVPARTRQHRHLAVDLLDHELVDTQLLAVTERRRFASRAARRHEMNPRVELPAHEPLDGCFVERSVLPKRGDERGTDTGKSVSHHGSYPLKTSCIEYQP